jgi:hypothetical protein
MLAERWRNNSEIIFVNWLAGRELQSQRLYYSLQTRLFIELYRETVIERRGQNLGTSSTQQNKKKRPYQHVSGNI